MRHETMTHHRRLKECRAARGARAVATGVLLVGAVALCGCGASTPERDQPEYWTDRDQSDVNAWSVRWPIEQQARAAAVAQRSIFAHHFRPRSDILNERGTRELAVILEDIGETGRGGLTFPRGDASADLYEARLATLRREMVLAGLNVDNVPIIDGLPDGEGQPSTRAAAAYVAPSLEEPYNIHGVKDEQ